MDKLTKLAAELRLTILVHGTIGIEQIPAVFVKNPDEKYGHWYTEEDLLKLKSSKDETSILVF